MRKLRKNMYVEGSTLFDLRHEQMCPRRVTLARHATWYNQFGEFLGAGSLSRDDFLTIHLRISPSDLFVVLVDDPHRRDSIPFSQVLEKAKFIISDQGIFYIPPLIDCDSRVIHVESLGTLRTHEFLKQYMSEISYDDAARLITEYTSKQ